MEDIDERKRSQPLASHSPREIPVLKPVALGRKNLTIAEEFGIGVGTIKVYVTRLFEKIRVPDRTQVAYSGYHSS